MRQFELVLPAYNEAPSLGRLVERVAQAAKAHAHTPETFQLVLVNNGSRDDTADVLMHLKQSPLGAWFKVVTVTANRGYGFGVRQGLEQTTAPVVGWSHADMQCDPADAFKAARLVQEGSAPLLVKGKRHGRNWKDRFVTRVFEVCARTLLGLKTGEINAQPKVFPRDLLTSLAGAPNGFDFDVFVLYQAQKRRYGLRTIAVEFPPRVHGVSKWAATFFGRYHTIGNVIYFMWELQRTEGRL